MFEFQDRLANNALTGRIRVLHALEKQLGRDFAHFFDVHIHRA